MVECGKEGLRVDRIQPAGPLPGSGSLEPTAGTARLLTVITSAPGVAVQSLRTTLESLPSIQIAGTTTGCLTALQMVGDRPTDLVVIDANLPLEEVQELLRQLGQEGRETHVLVLTQTTGEVYRALAVGADAALRRDASIQQLGAAIAELRQANRGSTPGPNDEVFSGG